MDPATGHEDLTARARIRQAALAQFAELGFERTTVRGVAAAAGVSPGLVRHHFGSKQGLRDAVDDWVFGVVKRVSDGALVDRDRGDLGPIAMGRAALIPFYNYLLQALLDGSPTAGAMFDRMVDVGTPWFEASGATQADEPFVDARTRSAVVAAMKLGVGLMRVHLSRALGVDTRSPEGDRLVALAMLDLFSRPIISRELAESAKAGMEQAATP